MFAIHKIERHTKPGKEAIHSGHFMVSHFEAEEQDDEDELAVPIPEVPEAKENVQLEVEEVKRQLWMEIENRDCQRSIIHQQQIAIDTSLSKLFQCMTLAYRQKLTSPKWNRFRGIRLRWKDKIRLNNVIWRCWHMQFIEKKSTLICQFASPLDVDTHNKPEAVVLEGKYWKRKLAAVTAEYKKWRMFYRNHSLGHAIKEAPDMIHDIDALTWNSQGSENMMVDEDYMGLMSDTLFSTITNQPFVFPDSREIARAGLADFIQPSLGPLQPNLDDYMDTFEPLEFISGKLPTVPEEYGTELKYNQWFTCQDFELPASNQNISTPQVIEQYQPVQQIQQAAINKPVAIEDTRQPLMQLLDPTYDSNILIQQAPVEAFNAPRPTQQPANPSVYQPQVISKPSKQLKTLLVQRKELIPAQQIQAGSLFTKAIDGSSYQTYHSVPDNSSISSVEDRLQSKLQEQQAASVSQTQGVLNFKIPQPNESHSSQGYKFSSPSTPIIPKFTSQQKEEKLDGRLRGTNKGKQRSRSTTREPMKRPPLLSAVSDPQLVTPNNSVLLTQLLTNSPENSTMLARNKSMSALLDSRTNQIRVKEESSPIPILPHPVTTTATLILTTHSHTVQANLNDQQLLLNTLSNSNSPILDTNSQGLNSPTSSQGSLGSPNRDTPHRDQRRVGHIHAEQKRRYNIKNGFDMIHSLIPHLHQNPNAKLSKAAMLQKGAEYIRQLRSERNQLKEEMDGLRQQIETLNTSISNCQSLLPATGAPVSRRRDSKMQEMFDEYVRSRTLDNWKFWIFSLLFKPLLMSFNNFVSTSSLTDLYRSTLHWVEQHCTLVDLRPVVLNSLRYLCTKTDILSEPEKLPEEARQAVAPTNTMNLTH